jgi:hypothetical protein
MEAARRGHLLAWAAKVLGAEAFNRLVASAPETRAKGRLRFWQVELLARLSDGPEQPVASMEDFLALFEGAQLQPLPEEPKRAITKAEFFADPVGVHLDPSVDSIPAEWFREVWDFEEEDPEKSLRKCVTGDVAHEANKGALPLLAGPLRSLAGVLRPDQWVGLYADIRDEEPHREGEIRQEFVRAAPHLAAALPAPLTRAEVVGRLGSEEARELGVFDDEAT